MAKSRAKWWDRFNLPDTCTIVEDIKLKPCPFCGAKAVMYRKRYKGSVNYLVSCSTNNQTDCAFQPYGYSVWDKRFKRSRTVASLWNKRA